MGSWSDSRELTRETWGVVKENPYMLLFPVTAAVIAGFLVLAVAAVGLGTHAQFAPLAGWEIFSLNIFFI